MSRVEDYRAELRELPRARWADFLTAHSGLPGPRGNLELARAFAEEADPASVDALIATDDEYLVFCGVVGLGRLLAEGGDDVLRERLRVHAADHRWRVREAAAMALQRLGDSDPQRMVAVVTDWADDPDPGLPRFLALSASSDPDVAWIVHDNRGKARLAKVL